MYFILSSDSCDILVLEFGEPFCQEQGDKGCFVESLFKIWR